jgi:transcriptional regulator with XRE-family HTH domain
MPRAFAAGSGFPQRLIKVMGERRLTLKQVQEETGISEKTLSNWRCGDRYPDRGLFYRFCGHYGISPRWLLLGSGEPEPQLQLRQASHRLVVHGRRLAELVTRHAGELPPAERIELLALLEGATQELARPAPAALQRSA